MVVSTQAFCAVKVGDPAPPIELDALLPKQPVENARLNALSGKAVVLEFWATWCGPCYFAIPHLNQLAKQFEGRPIQFLSITDEEQSLVESFLKKRPINGWVGFDHKSALQKAYGFAGIPVTVLIDSTGRIAAISHPAALEASHIEDLLAGRDVKLPLPEVVTDMSLPRTGEKSGVAPLVDIVLRPSTSDDMSMSVNKTKYQVKHVTLRWLLASAYDFPEDRVTGDSVDDPTRYDISLELPAAQGKSLNDVLRGIVCAAFGLTVKLQTRDTEVLVLTAPKGKPESLRETATPGKQLWSSQNGEVHIVNYPVAVLASAVQGHIHKNVVDETGIQGRYDFDFRVDEKNPSSILSVVRAYGFAINPGIRPMEFLVTNRIH